MKPLAEITLAPDQRAYYDSLVKRCASIEKVLATPVDTTNTVKLSSELSRRIDMLSLLPSVMSDAVQIYDWSKGQIAKIVLEDERLLNAKQDIQRLFIQGRLAKFNALYTRAETVSKDLRNSVEGIRTLLSFEKELIRNTTTNNEVTL